MRNKNILTLAALMLALGAVAATAAMRPVLKKRAGLPPFDVIKEIVRGNDSWGAGRDGKLLCAWLADSGPGLVPERIIARPAGRILAARNLRGRLTPEAARTMDLAVNVLHLPVLLIARTADSGYIRAITGRPLPRQPEEKRKLIEAEVDRLVDTALKRYRRRVKGGRLVVAGSVFDQENWYGRGRGRLIIINLNGETDRAALRKHPASSLLDADERGIHLGRDLNP